jgi:sulfur transfer complex TusBCD TusB component (DsrH family)
MLIQLLVNKPELVVPFLPTGTETATIVLLQDGVYSAQNLHKHFPQLVIYAISDDWQCAGLPNEHNLTLISCEQWVDLCAENQPVITLQ